MEKTYQITGMKCQGCANKVKTKLQAVAGVKDVQVDLDSKTVKVEGLILDILLKRALKDTKFKIEK